MGDTFRRAGRELWTRSSKEAKPGDLVGERQPCGKRATPDGHLVGSIGEVVAAEALGLTLYPMSRSGHDAYDTNGDIQIKMTARRSVAMYSECVRLVVLRILPPEEAEIVYDGPGQPVWASAGPVQKNGQRTREARGRS